MMNILKRHKTYSDVLKEFLEDRSIAVSKGTYGNCVSKFKVITAWFIKYGLYDKSLQKITDSTISKFFVYLAVERQLDRPTCEKYFLSIRSFFRFAQMRGYIADIPCNTITFPNKKEDRGAKVILKDDLIRLLEIIRAKNPQLYLACMFQYYCFIRPGRELRLLKVGDVDLAAGVIRIPAQRAKNRRAEVVTMPKQLITLCQEYGLENANKELYVFGKGGKISSRPWGYNTLPYKFDMFRDMLGISKEIKFYSMKHTGVTMLAESGAPIRSIMDQCRHTNLSATQHYLKRHAGLVNERIRDYFPSPI
jgi:integrase